MARKRTWREKLNQDQGLPKVVPIGDKMSRKWGAGTCVVPAPTEVDQIMSRVRKGRLITINEIRSILAHKHGATIGCPMTTGIFAWIAAHAAAEAEEAGLKRFTPYWRTLKADGELNPKYPGGIKNLKNRLEAEGHRVVQKGKRHLVADFKKSLARV